MHMEFKLSSFSQYIILLLLSVPLLVTSYHGSANTITSPPQKPLKFYMTPMHRSKPVHDDLDAIRGPVIPDAESIVMLVNISIGNPPVPQLVIMDTGSELLWVQCAPCKKCFNQISPIYDPSKSQTFSNVSCASVLCPGRCKGRWDANCPYRRTYADGTSTNGTLSTEQLTFRKIEDGTVTGIENDVVFGCGTENSTPGKPNGESGILGLDASPYSLTTQRGRKFSYCIGNASDHSYAHNQLIIGDGAVMLGYSTPLEVFNNWYYVTMWGISVDGKSLEIDSLVFQRSPLGEGGVLFDSGSTNTFLPKPAYEALVERVEEWASGLLNRREIPDRLCYWGTISRDTVGFPAVTLQFASGAELELGRYSVFDQGLPDTFCLAFKAALDDEPSIIGLKAQQGYNFGYDPDGKNLYIYSVDCQLLDS